MVLSAEAPNSTLTLEGAQPHGNHLPWKLSRGWRPFIAFNNISCFHLLHRDSLGRYKGLVGGVH